MTIRGLAAEVSIWDTELHVSTGTGMTLTWTGDRSFSLDPKNSEFYNNPYPAYAELHRRAGPVFWENYGMWCLSGFADVDSCLRDKRFARLPPHGCPQKSYPDHLQSFAAAERYSLLALEGANHRRLRKRVSRAFASRAVSSLRESIATIANTCIDTFVDDHHVDLLSRYATPIPVQVIAGLLGVPQADSDRLLEWSHRMVVVYTMTQSHADELAADTAANEFIAYIEGLIDARRAQPGDDLLSQLVRNDDDPLTDAEITSLVILLLNAGHEATVHQLGNSICLLLQQPPQAECWWRSPEMLDRVVAECLRFDPPLHLFTRFAQQDVDLGCGVQLSRGQELSLLLGAANRCPAQFTQADCFILERPQQTSVALGAGAHFCAGAALAKLELAVALQTLFERLPGLQLVERPLYRDAFHFHGLQSLHVRW